MVKWEFVFGGERIKFTKSHFYGYIFMSLSTPAAFDDEDRWGTCYLQFKNPPLPGTWNDEILYNNWDIVSLKLLWVRCPCVELYEWKNDFYKQHIPVHKFDLNIPFL